MAAGKAEQEPAAGDVARPGVVAFHVARIAAALRDDLAALEGAAGAQHRNGGFGDLEFQR